MADSPSRPTALTRRDFLASSASLLALGLLPQAPAIHLPSRKTFDVIIRGGTVFDGTGRPGRESDVAILGDRIAALGVERSRDDARLVIDARGLAVAPGFIDIHSHADGTMFQDPRSESVIRQGVTTVIVGQDGSSHGPTTDGKSLADAFTAIDALPPTLNVASMVGLGTVRHVVVGDADRPATADELARMVQLVQAGLSAGACGASSGLEYTPGEFAPRDELVALCRPLAALGLPYATHMRNEDDRVLESVDEAIAVATGAGCPLQISHLKTEGPRNWGKLDTIFAHIDRAHRAGLDVAFDRYPYDAYQTGLSNLFPKWSEDGGTDAFLARLADPSLTSKLRDAVNGKIALLGGWDHVLISNVQDPGDRAVEGQRLGAYATATHQDPYDAAVALLTRSHGDVGMVGFAMSDDNLKRILAHPLGMVCSDGGAVALDGPAHAGHPHPRSLGTFPRILGTYVRETRTLTLPQAINKMTALPASRVRLADRGRLARGMAADVVVFDPATVRDRATYAEPFQYPEGIRAVLVNGVVALRDGEHSETRRGRVLRPAPVRR
jgi:N-acyl-D-amino-acid deacylase